MRLYRHHGDLVSAHRGAVVTLGNFDGVHRGHQAVIAAARDIARAAGAPLGVVTFEPHTRSFFLPDSPPFRLTPFRAKIRALAALGVDFVLVQTFDQAFSELSAEAFVDRVLVRGLNIRHAVAGHDFRYGHKHRGDMARLAEAGRAAGFGVTALTAQASPDGQIFSATAIRGTIAAGDLRRAAELLGRPWEITNRVVRGDQRGRHLGFPTANLRLGDHLRPAYGVYAVRARLDGPDTRWINGVASLGIRPMWLLEEPLLEAHLFDFKGDLYGKVLRVALIERLRGERKFDDIHALIDQVERDKAAARAMLPPPGQG